jgi:WD40 repeat protein
MRHSKGSTYVLPQDDSRPVRIWEVKADGLVETCCLDMRVDGAWFSNAFNPTTLHLKRGNFIQDYVQLLNEGTAKWISTSSPSRMDGSWDNGHWTDSVEVDGTPFVLSASVGSVNIWNLAHKPIEAADSVFFRESPTCMFVSEATSGSIYCGTESGKVLAFDIDTGLQTWECNVTPNRQIRTIAGYSDSSGLTLAMASQDEILLLKAGGDIDPMAVIHTGGHVYRMDIAWVADDPLLFASVDSGQINAVRIWNLRTKLELDTQRTDPHGVSSKWRYQLDSGQEDKPINSLLCLSQGDSARLVFASKYSQVMVADYPPVESAGHVRLRAESFDIWKIPGSMIARVLSLAQTRDANFIAAGTDEGSLTLWHAPSRKRIAWRENVHLTDWIRALAFNDACPVLMLASGADDGVVRFWDGELNPLLHINLGSPVCSIRFVDARRVAVATENGLVVIALDQWAMESIASA